VEKLSYNDKLRMQTLREEGRGEKLEIHHFQTKGESWALLKKSAVVCSTQKMTDQVTGGRKCKTGKWRTR